MHTYNFSISLVLLTCSSLLSGCQSWYGPSALTDTHPAYNQAMVNSLSHEMLLNLVRLKYRDRAYFLKINSITASMSLKSNLGIKGGEFVTPNAGVAFSQSPTISYAPLDGEDFLKSLLSPIPLDAVLIMAQSGWNTDFIFSLCIYRINDLKNAPHASGPTPLTKPKFQDFKKFIKSIHYLQNQGLIEIGVNIESDYKVSIQFMPTEDKQALIEIQAIRDLLKLNNSNRYLFSTNLLYNNSKTWNLRVRSISSIMYYLSQNIDIPVEHKQRGLVTNTVTKDGKFFDWGETPAGVLFKIHSSSSKPDKTYLSVYYRDTWFYIADNDLESKSTFILLTQLFSLQAGQSTSVGPTLTIPVGNR